MTRSLPLLMCIGILALMVIALAGLSFGAVDVPFASVLQVLAHPGADTDDLRAAAVVVQMRLPRVIAGIVVGSALGGAGCILQALFRNSLGSPQSLGASNAAAFGAVLALYLGMPYIATVTFGFAAAAIAVLGVILLARMHDGVPRDSVVLAGLNMGLLFGALTGLLQYAARDDAQLRDMVLWLLGGLWRVTWQPLVVLAPVAIATLIAVFPLARALDLLGIGEADALRLGVDVKRVRFWAIFAACLLTTLAVCLSGVVAFVGLVVPHAARKIVGTGHRLAFPASCIAGAGVVVLADLVARTIIVPSELPLGVVTSLIGVPVFFALMRARARKAAIA